MIRLIPFAYGMTKVWRTASVYCCILIALERAAAMRWPFLSRRLKNAKRAKYSIIGVFVFSFLLNIPTFFQQNFDATNGRLTQKSEWIRNWYFRNLYTNGIYLTLMYVLPLILLLTLNLIILFAMKMQPKDSIGGFNCKNNIGGIASGSIHRRRRFSVETRQISTITMLIIARYVLSNSIIVTSDCNYSKISDNKKRNFFFWSNFPHFPQ